MILLHRRLHPLHAKAVIAPLFGDIIPLVKVRLRPGRVLDGKVELAFIDGHVNAQETFPFFDQTAGFQSIIHKVSQNHTQIHVLHGNFLRNPHLTVDGDSLSPRKGELAVQNRVHHHVPRLYQGIHMVKFFFQRVQVIPDLGQAPHSKLSLHHLHMIVVIVPPATHIHVDAFDLLILILHQLLTELLCPELKSPFIG